MNYNRFLENSQRSDVIGRNIYTMGRGHDSDAFRREMTAWPHRDWDTPSLGLPGVIAIGHQIDVKDVLTLKIMADGREQAFTPVRNRWTPAWMQTYYRSAPDTEYYPRSGVLCVKECKGFLPDDTFLAELTLFNDKRETVEAEISLEVPFADIGAGCYAVEAKTQPGSLGKQYPLNGFAAAITDGSGKVTIPANGSVTVRYAFAYDPEDKEAAMERARAAFDIREPFQLCEERFNRWMEEHTPKLETENTDILKIYYYRYFLIYRGIHTPDAVIPGHDFEGECVYESPFGYWFGATVGLSVPLQVEEMKWMKDRHAVYSQLHNWKRGAGNSKGYIQATPMAVWNLYQLTGDRSLLEELYGDCRGYSFGKYDPEKPEQLPVTSGSWGTGAEYQPSFYQYTEPKWDWRNDNEGVWWNQGFEFTELYRVDECMFLAGNLTACANMARVLEKTEDQAMLEECAGTVLRRIRELCWNEEKGFFFDCDVKTGRQCGEAYCYDGFFPMLWNLFGKDYYKVFSYLEKDGPFDCDFPVISVDKNCPMYWFDNCLTGPTAASEKEPHYYECSWNGPTWPFATSFVLEALGAAAAEDEGLQGLWNRLFERYTELHFDGGDRSLPRLAEHYRGTDGVSFSPYHEYFHSTWVTLFMSYWAGIHVEDGQVSFAPMTKAEFTLEGVELWGRKYRFKQYRDGNEMKTAVERMG